VLPDGTFVNEKDSLRCGYFWRRIGLTNYYKMSKWRRREGEESLWLELVVGSLTMSQRIGGVGRADVTPEGSTAGRRQLLGDKRLLVEWPLDLGNRWLRCRRDSNSWPPHL
jgi:hypothetical protein